MIRIFLTVLLVALAYPADAHAFWFLAAIPAAAAAAGSGAAAAGAAAAASAAAVGGAAAAAAGTATAAAATASTIITAAQIASGVLSAAGTLFGAVASKKQADAEAAQLKIKASLEETAGLQRDTIRREQLERTLGAIKAARGGRGHFSPTATSFLDEANEFINSDRTVELLNSRQASADYREQAAIARRRGRAALTSGIVQSGMSLFQVGSYGARKF